MGALDGKVALVTGGSSGIGRGTAERFAAEGATVVITDIQVAEGEALAASLKGVFLKHDVTQESEWESVIAEVDRRFGRLDVLVNNAGIAIGAPDITQMSLDDWRKQQAINVEGVFLGLKHSLPLMRRAGNGGSVINLSSVAGLKGSPAMAAYCATKGAVRLLTKSVALECTAAQDGIRVNSVHPGLIETPIWIDIARTTRPGENQPMDLDAASSVAVPLGRKGVPAEIAAGILWLASDESRYVTGAELVIDGGLTVR